MASGWSNPPHWPPSGPRPGFAGPPRPVQPNTSVRAHGPPIAFYGFPVPTSPMVVDLCPPVRRGGLLPHPPLRASGGLAIPFPDPRQQIRLGQRAPQPPDMRGGVNIPIRPAHVPLTVTQQPVLLMSSGSSTSTSGNVSSTNSHPNNHLRRRQGRNTDDSSSGRSEGSRSRSSSGVHPRPPTPVSSLAVLSPLRPRRSYRTWSPPYLYGDVDDDDYDLVYDYRFEFEPYDLSEDSDDDMYFLAPHSFRDSPPARLKGGYECQFVKPFTSEVQTECSICLSVLREPFLVDCCGYRFCKSCIETVSDDLKPCPLCNKDFKTFPDKQLQRMLNQKEVYCKHKDEGCEWTGVLTKLDEHLNINCEDSNKHLDGCKYSMLTCKHCEKSVQRKDFKLHNIRCSGEKYTCEYCNEYSASYHRVTEDHWPECPAHPVDCPNGCGDETLKRREVNKHVACDCPQTVVQCDLAHYGCNVELPRVDMTSHLESGTVDHISLLLKKITELQAENDGLKEEFADVAFELYCVKDMNGVFEDIDDFIEELKRKDGELEEKDCEIQRLQKQLEEATMHTKASPSSHQMPAVTLLPPSYSNDNTKALLVSNLPSNVNEQKLKSLLGPFGRVIKVKILKNSDALVFFEHPDSVNKAMTKNKTCPLKLHGHKLSLHESSYPIH